MVKTLKNKIYLYIPSNSYKLTMNNDEFYNVSPKFIDFYNILYSQKFDYNIQFTKNQIINVLLFYIHENKLSDDTTKTQDDDSDSIELIDISDDEDVKESNYDTLIESFNVEAKINLDQQLKDLLQVHPNKITNYNYINLASDMKKLYFNI